MYRERLTYSEFFGFGHSRVMLAAMIVLLCALWLALDGQRRENLRTAAETQARHHAHVLKRDLETRVAAAQRMADVWIGDLAMSGDSFRFLGNALVRDYNGLKGVSFADASHKISHLLTPEAMGMIGRDIRQLDPTGAEALERARETGLPQITPPVFLADQTGTGFVVFLPVGQQDRFQGTLNVIFLATDWIDGLIFDPTDQEFLPDFATRITLGGDVVFETADFAPQGRAYQSEAVQLWNGAIQVLLQPRARFVDRYWNWLPETVCLLALVTFGAVFITSRLLSRALEAETRAIGSNETLTATNARLKREIKDRKQAEERASEAQRATERFLTTISHEIRTPLNAIMGMFELISVSKDVPDRQKRQARAGLDASDRLFRELSNVLDASRLDAQAMQIDFSASQGQRLIESWETILEGAIKRSGKDLAARFVSAPDLPDTWHLDGKRVTQIVTNLLDNAVKFTISGQIVLSVRRDFRDPTALRLQVTDSGPGIDDESAEHIFERFYQVKTGAKQGGTGLGLSISRDLARLMGGDLTQNSDPGCGATFTLALPGVFEHVAEDRRSEVGA